MEEGEAEGNVKVLGYWVSLFTHRVRWALRLKAVPYQYIEQDILNKPPSLLAFNPIYGKVPVLVHAGNPLPESTIILHYIDEVWNHGPPLFPADPYQRSQARFWARFADEKVMESAWFLMFARGEKLEKVVEALADNLEKIEQKLVHEGKPFFGGNTIGYLDFVMGFISYIVPAWEQVAGVKVLDPAKFPAIVAWADNFLNHPVVKAEYMPPMDETVSCYKGSTEELRSNPKYIALFGE